ncbi:MAG: hypothetical protein ACT4QE_21295 [Anaerolineales bacterium]
MTDAASQVQAQRDVNIGGDQVLRDKVVNTYNVNIARSGLEALAELMRAERVRDDIVAFRNDFVEASRQIDILGDYKELHDLLHQLEFGCYKLLVVVARSFSNDAAENSDLVECQINLERIVAQMQTVAARQKVARQDVAWLPRLTALPDELGNVKSKDQLDKILRALRRVLEVQPSQINKRLNDTARALRLNTMVQALSATRDRLLGQPDLDPDKVREFKEGVDELVKIGMALITLVDDHDAWQFVQVELIRIEAFMELGSQELAEAFPYLKVHVEPLCVNRDDRGAQALLKEGQRLEEALATGQVGRINLSFMSYCARAGDLFFRIDTDLRQLCGKLRTVGEPLAGVLRMSV